MKKTEIKFTVELDDNHLPENIQWEAKDAGESSNCKSMMVALWDQKENNTLRIDLWTKDMSIDEMKKFYHQNILTLTDTYLRATGDQLTVNEVREFFKGLGSKMGVLQ